MDSEERRFYDHLKCPVCGVPWFDYGPLRWPLHSRECGGHRFRPRFPFPLADDKAAVANLPAHLKPVKRRVADAS